MITEKEYKAIAKIIKSETTSWYNDDMTQNEVIEPERLCEALADHFEKKHKQDAKKFERLMKQDKDRYVRRKHLIKIRESVFNRKKFLKNCGVNK